MKTACIVIFLLLFAWVARADFSPTIREIDHVDYEEWHLHVVCDVPRGNVLYIVKTGGFNGVSVAVIHQPEMCH